MSKPLASMTGFGRGTAQAEGAVISCELKSVNGRNLDIRTRYPSVLDSLEPEFRRVISSKITRGSLQLSINIQRENKQEELVINHQALNAVLDVIADIAQRVDIQKPSIEGILALKGILDTKDASLSGDAEEAFNAAVVQAVDTASSALAHSREQEGAAIATMLHAHLDEISRLRDAAENHPSRTREAIIARMQDQVEAIISSSKDLNHDRLHQEALLLATKADIREELDRLKAHVDGALKLLNAGGPQGRKLDFIGQEFNRESNTLCSKSNDVTLTAIGLDLKAVIDQYREQVLNLE